MFLWLGCVVSWYIYPVCFYFELGCRVLLSITERKYTPPLMPYQNVGFVNVVFCCNACCLLLLHLLSPFLPFPLFLLVQVFPLKPSCAVCWCPFCCLFLIVHQSFKCKLQKIHFCIAIQIKKSKVFNNCCGACQNMRHHWQWVCWCIVVALEIEMCLINELRFHSWRDLGEIYEDQKYLTFDRTNNNWNFYLLMRVNVSFFSFLLFFLFFSSF